MGEDVPNMYSEEHGIFLITIIEMLSLLLFLLLSCVVFFKCFVVFVHMAACCMHRNILHSKRDFFFL